MLIHIAQAVSSSLPIPPAIMPAVIESSGGIIHNFAPLMMFIIAAEGFILLSGFGISLLPKLVDWYRKKRDLAVLAKYGYVATKLEKIDDTLAKAIADIKKLGFAVEKAPRGGQAEILHKKFKQLLK